MLARQPQRMSFDEYLAWEAEQPEKWELVDGLPVRRSDRWERDPVTGMAGATLRHNRIVSNLISALRSRLGGGPCEALPSDLKVKNARDEVHYPDVLVNCARGLDDALVAPEPKVVFEVLSKSNTFRQQLRLLDDYQATPAVQHVVFIEQYSVGAIVWTRGSAGWAREEVAALEAVIRLPAIGVELPMADVYENVGFDPAR